MNNKRNNGITIILNKQVLVTQPPTNEDNKLIYNTFQLHQDWIKDGMPQSNQGF